MINYPYPSVYHAIKAIAKSSPDAPALTLVTQLEPEFQSLSCNYQQFFASMCQAARLVKAVTDTDRPVASFLLPNIPQAHAIMWGSEAVGITNPLNPLLSVEALQSLMAVAETDVVFALGPNPVTDIWEKAQAVVEGLERKPVLIPVLFPAEGYKTFEQYQAEQSAADLPDAWLPGLDDTAAYFHTGGTTGTPKLALNSHRNQLACVALHRVALEVTDKDKVINGLPLFHVAGSIVNGLSTLCAGMEMVLPTIAGFRDPAVIKNHWRMVEHYGATITGGIPTSISSMLNVPVAESDISSLRFLIGGGSPVSASLCESVRLLLGVELYQIYGMTECAGGIAMPNLSEPSVPGSAGYVRNDIVQIRVDGASQAGDSGEVLIKGDVVFPGYLGGQDASVRDGWLHSGDLGHIDVSGNLYITGRAKDLIIRSGHNIDPALIENCLDKHPAVAMSVAVGKPDAYAGELPVAYVQLHEGKEVGVDELMAYAKENIAERPACPKFIKILPQLPVTAVGKLHKPSLRVMTAELALGELIEEAGGEAQLSASLLKTGEIQVDVAKLGGVGVAQVEALAAQLSLQICVS